MTTEDEAARQRMIDLQTRPGTRSWQIQWNDPSTAPPNKRLLLLYPGPRLVVGFWQDDRKCDGCHQRVSGTAGWFKEVPHFRVSDPIDPPLGWHDLDSQ